ncbi:MAG TPA: YheC/YheD family protein [Bacillota bacterium]|nr:YheC/YheD family protein [Bacillota bacterium]
MISLNEPQQEEPVLLRPSNTTIWPLQGYRNGKWQICHSRREALQYRWQKFTSIASSAAQTFQSTAADTDCIAFSDETLPVFGILYRDVTVSNHETGFGFEDYHFRQLARLSTNYGFRTVVFSPKGLDYTHQTMEGYCLTSKSEWQFELFPLPSVIYYRGVSIYIEENSERIQALQCLTCLGIPSLNNSLFTLLLDHKLNFYLFLKETYLSSFLPETREYCGDALSEMLQHYRVLFLKPTAGYESRGLIRLQQTDSVWQIDYNDDDGVLSTRNLFSVNDLLQYVNQVIHSQDYLIQAGIASFQWDHKIFEQRILMQRCGKNWLQACHVIRSSGSQDIPFITAEREITANSNALAALLSIKQRDRVEAQIQTAIRGLTHLFEQKPYEASEFSCDFMLDTAGKIWLLECNAKPSGFFIQTGDLDGRMAYLRHTLQQAAYLHQKA